MKKDSIKKFRCVVHPGWSPSVPTVVTGKYGRGDIGPNKRFCIVCGAREDDVSSQVIA